MNAKRTSANLITAALVGLVLGLPMLIAQRWIADTRGVAMAMVAAWIAIVGVAVLVLVRRRPELRLAAGGTWLAVVVGVVAVGYWTGFRDTEVMEEVAMASTVASPSERERGLEGSAGGAGADGAARTSGAPPREPVELASGEIIGADGHSGAGTATVVEQPDGTRLLTLTDLDVDPGPAVEVYLTPTTDDVSDRVELGGLKGNVGDQQYEIPAGADLSAYSSLVLWCTPFTTRIAVAELD